MLEAVEDALDAVPTVIAVDAFRTASSRRADVFLPATVWGEKCVMRLLERNRAFLDLAELARQTRCQLHE